MIKMTIFKKHISLYIVFCDYFTPSVPPISIKDTGDTRQGYRQFSIAYRKELVTGSNLCEVAAALEFSHVKVTGIQPVRLVNDPVHNRIRQNAAA